MANHRLRIAVACKGFPVRSQTFILNQILDLIQKGHEVDIIAYVKHEGWEVHSGYTKYGLSERITAINLPENIFKRLLGVFTYIITHPKYFFKILKTLNFIKYGKESLKLRLFYTAKVYFERQSYDIYQGHFGENGILLTAMKDAGIINGKIVTTFHGYDAHFSEGNFSRIKGMYKLLFSSDSLFTVNSDYTWKQILKLGANPDRIYKVPVGLDTEKYKPDPLMKIADGNLRLLSVGRLVPFKGFQFSINAVAKVIKDGHKDILYYIIGDGEQYQYLKELIVSLNMSDHIFLSGAQNQEEIIAKMSEADIFLHPAISEQNGRQENQGLVIQEAQALKLPVITTRTGGIPEGILENISGLLVDEKNTDQIAEAILFFKRNNEKLGTFGEAGRKFVEENFDIKIINNRLIRVYEM